MPDILKTSKFWNYLAISFGLMGTAATGIAATIQQKENNAEIMKKLEELVNKGLQQVAKEAK